MLEVMAIGDKVVKDPAGWVPSDFDRWSAGIGVGEIVALSKNKNGVIDGVDVRWPTGRAWQLPQELSPAPVGLPQYLVQE